MLKLSDLFSDGDTGWPKQSKQRSAADEGKKKARPKRGGMTSAKLGLVGFLVFCLVVVALDLNDSSRQAELSDIPLPAAADPEPSNDGQPAVVEPPVEVVEPAEAAASVFAGYRLDREQSRSEELALLQEIINDPNSSAEVRDEAEQRRLSVSANIEKEMLSESLLDAKGFGETVVLLGATQATVVCSIQLDAVKATQIAEIVGENCGVGFENVVIVNR